MRKGPSISGVSVVAAVGLALAACGGGSQGLKGSLDVASADAAKKTDDGSRCESPNPSVDAGDRVTIRNEKGTTVAVTTLRPGKLVVRRQIFETCRFSFAIDDIESADFYRVRIGDLDPYEISRKEIEKDNWTLRLRVEGLAF